jgi:hypothetical protein
MAFDAPRHSQFLLYGNSIHGFHWSVALLALQVCLDVSFVREMHKIRNIMDLDPGYWLLVGKVLCNLDNLGFVSGYRSMTTHAFFDGWDPGRWRTGRVDMTVLAGNFIFPGVNFVTEFNGLDRAVVVEISIVYPDSRNKTGQPDKHNQSRFLKMLKSFQNRD